MNSVKKYLSALLAVLMLLSAFTLAACRNDGNPDATGDTTEEQTEAEPEDLIIASGKESGFRFVIPDSCSGDVLEGVKTAVNAIENTSGARLSYTRDSFSKYDPDAYEIYVGELDREESRAVMNTLRAGEYAIVRSGKKIVIVGTSDELLVRALTYFAKNTVPKNKVKNDDGTVNVLFVEFRFQADIPVSSLKIGSAELKDFVIVYADGVTGYGRPAKALAEEIEKQYGYKLEVRADRRAEEVKNEILVGPTNRAQSASFAAAHPAGLMQFSMGANGDKFIINALPYSALAAVTKFGANYLYAGKEVTIPDGTIVSEDLRTVTDVPLASGADIRIMTANILAEFESWGGTTPIAERAEIFASVLEVWHPDVAGVQEVTDLWYSTLPKYVSDTYAFIHPQTPDNKTNYSSILYDKTKYNVINSGVRYFTTEGPGNIRLVTWAVFSPKNGGENFILFNSHWCWDTEEHAHQQALEESKLIAEVTAKYPYQYFCTADYNTKQDTANYKYFLELTGAVDAKYAARDKGVLLNVAGGCGELGDARPESGNSIDHIFMSKTLTPCAFATVVANRTYDISDHSPKYVDVKLK